MTRDDTGHQPQRLARRLTFAAVGHAQQSQLIGLHGGLPVLV